MRSLILGLLIGTFAAVLLERLRLRAKIEAAGAPPRAAPVTAAEAPTGQSGERGHDSFSDHLTQMTRQQLYRRAQAAGIVGRSEMSKAQLIAGLRAING
jgi:hypothetical protein